MQEITVLNLTKAPHCSMIYTGLHMLAKQKKIRLKWNIEEKTDIPHENIVELLIDSKLRIAFDMSDGYQHDNDALTNYLKSVDIYYKRSNDEQMNIKLFGNLSKKIKPFTFNYYVTYIGNPADRQSNSIDTVIVTLKKIRNKCLVRQIEKKPKKRNTFNIIFYCRLWDPCAPEIQGNIALQNQRREINKTRIEIVRQLKQKYPNFFQGGVEASPLAAELCPDLIVPFEESLRRNYLKAMKKADICIGTTGLHKSIGWKIAEYIAASKAIVAEKFEYDTVGEWEDGKNYISFNSADSCISAIEALVQSPTAVFEMKKANRDYYKSFSKPDAAIWNAILSSNETT